MALREGILRDEIKRTQVLYSNTEADRRVMAVALGRMQGDGKPAAGDKAVKIR